MAKENKDVKTFTMRLPKNVWMFLKRAAVDQEIPMTEIIVRCVEKYKKKFDDKLTKTDT